MAVEDRARCCVRIFGGIEDELCEIGVEGVALREECGDLVEGRCAMDGGAVGELVGIGGETGAEGVGGVAEIDEERVSGAARFSEELFGWW